MNIHMNGKSDDHHRDIDQMFSRRSTLLDIQEE